MISETIRGIIAFFEGLHDLTQSQTMEDSIAYIPVIGEYSSGKTRFVSELIRASAPPDLLPVSALEPETLIPLDVTFGKIPKLFLLNRPNKKISPSATECSDNGTTIELERFPNRTELTTGTTDLASSRLRLEVPESRLILQNGDGIAESDSPMRMRIVDLPGWNSHDEKDDGSARLSLSPDDYYLSIVYVVHSCRVDGEQNRIMLRNFFEMLETVLFSGIPSVTCVVTHCPKAQSSRMREIMNTRIEETLDQIGAPQKPKTHVMCIDFETLDETEKTEFANSFWDSLRVLDEERSVRPWWISAIDRKRDEFDVRPYVLDSLSKIEKAQQIIDATEQDGRYLPEMNMARLLGYSGEKKRLKILAHWQSLCNIDISNIDGEFSVPSPPDNHPLHKWWMAFWVPRLSTTLASVKHYIREMNASISTVPDKLAPDRHSLSDYLKVRMRRFSANAKGSICNSFVTHYRTLPDQFHNPLSEILINLFMISLRVEMDDAQEIRRFMMRYESTTTTDDWRITS